VSPTALLAHLHVVNLGVIEDSAIDLGPGLNVITGETGAGKTLLLGGLRLLLGEKAEASLVGGQGDEARVEGLFVEGDEEIAVARAVPRTGRSRAHADGVLVSAGALTERIGPRVEIVGQHDQLTLRRPASILAMVDAFGGDAVSGPLASYREAWDELQRAERDMAALGGDEMTLRRELDLVAFQATEIESEALAEGDDHALEAEASRLRNLEEITGHLAESGRLLEGIAEDGGEVVARLRKVGDLDASSQGLASQAEMLAEAAHDLTRDVMSAVEGLEPEPGRFEEVERRLTVIGDLKRKYGRTVDEVTAFGRAARARAGEIERLLDRADDMDREAARAHQALIAAAGELSTARAHASRRLVERALTHLGDLGMESPALEVRLTPAEAGPTGADRAELWFASDKRLDLVPVGSGASGGELSRLVLAMRLAARVGTGGSLVFDEVDTGIGGATALSMGRKLAELAGTSQVVCVTHLPQVAAFAHTHFVVTREGGSAEARTVTGEDRLKEISRMLAGLPESVAGHEAAAELLALAGR
jgi:DNA repair protein RecN (Recombination protein N)